MQITYFVDSPTDDTGLFARFDLLEGRWPTSTELTMGSTIVSSEEIADKFVVGRPRIFGNQFDLTFTGLSNAFTVLPAAGRYVIDSPNVRVSEEFFGLVRDRLLDLGVAPQSLNLAASSDELPEADPFFRPAMAAVLALMAAACLLASTSVLRSAREVGVRRLFGFSVTRIWLSLTVSVHLRSTAIALAICCALGLLIPGGDWRYTLTAALLTIATALASSLIALVVAALTIKKNHVQDLAKGAL